MGLTNCRHCNHPIRYDSDDKKVVFCVDCSLMYTQACIKIHQFVADNPKPEGYRSKDIDLLADGTQLPRAFIRQYFLEAATARSVITPTQQCRCCIICTQQLSFLERRYCRSCAPTVMELVEQFLTLLKTFRSGYEQSLNNRFS